MSTIADLDTELAAAIVAQTSLTQRMLSDYDDAGGELIPVGAFRFRQRIDAVVRSAQGSNDFQPDLQVEVDALVKLTDPGDETTERLTLWDDQQTLTDPVFWRSLAAIYDVNGVDGPPQTVEEIQRVGRVLRFTVTARVILAP